MTKNDKAVETPEPSKYIQWLNKEEFQLETTVPFESDSVSWSRKTRYGTPRCETNGDIMIVVTKVGDRFSMGVRASTKNYWANVEVYDIDEDYLVARGRQMEHRLVDAWRELRV